MSHHYVQFTDVHYKYPGSDIEALAGVSFRIGHGERVALLGLNGSGKSTLLLNIVGLLLPTSGEVNVGDMPVTKKTAPRVRQTVGLVFQDANDQLFMPTIGEDVAFGPRNMCLPESEVERRVVTSLNAVGCLDLRDKSASELSGGQRRAAAIATVLAMEPSILVLDEPTANLDRSARRRLIEILKDFRHTVIIATHDLELVAEYCQRSIFLSHGTVVADKNTSSLLSDRDFLESEHMDIPEWLSTALCAVSSEQN